MLLLRWGKRRGNEWEAVRVYKESWPIFWRNCQEIYWTIRVWRRGFRLWCSLVEVYYPEGGKSWTLGPTPLKGWRIRKQEATSWFFLCLPLSPLMPQCSPLRQVLCRKRNPCCSSLTLASEGRRWGCGWDVISDQLAPECQFKVSSATLRHNPIAIQGAKRCGGATSSPTAYYGPVYQEELV